MDIYQTTNIVLKACCGAKEIILKNADDVRVFDNFIKVIKEDSYCYIIPLDNIEYLSTTKETLGDD